MDCAEIAEGSGVAVIADGGMDTGSSFCKALAAGAHAALMGRAFAATYESPARSYADGDGKIPIITDRRAPDKDDEKGQLLYKQGVFKEYRGSASMEAQVLYKPDRDDLVSEGVRSLVQVAGPARRILGRFNGALRSSMSYVGARNLAEYREKVVFMLVSDGVFNQQKARSLQSFEVTV